METHLRGTECDAMPGCDDRALEASIAQCPRPTRPVLARHDADNEGSIILECFEPGNPTSIAFRLRVTRLRQGARNA